MSKTRSARELSLVADQLVDKRLQRVEGVARIDISGLATREVRIDLDPARLRFFKAWAGLRLTRTINVKESAP